MKIVENDTELALLLPGRLVVPLIQLEAAFYTQVTKTPYANMESADRDILTGIAALTGREVPVVWGPRRAGDPPALVADPTAAREALGFATLNSDLKTILAHSAPWFGLQRVRA